MNMINLTISNEENLLLEAFKVLFKDQKPDSYSENRFALNYYPWRIDGCYDQKDKQMLFLNLRNDKTMMQYETQELSLEFHKIVKLLITNPDESYSVVIEDKELMSDRKKKYLNHVMNTFTLRMIEIKKNKLIVKQTIESI